MRCCQGVRGWRIPQSLQWAQVLSGQIPCTKTFLRTEPGLPALLPLSSRNTMKFSVVTKIRENAPEKVNDLRLVSREP